MSISDLNFTEIASSVLCFEVKYYYYLHSIKRICLYVRSIHYIVFECPTKAYFHFVSSFNLSSAGRKNANYQIQAT
jgi:hypothetical protein